MNHSIGVSAVGHVRSVPASRPALALSLGLFVNFVGDVLELVLLVLHLGFVELLVRLVPRPVHALRPPVAPPQLGLEGAVGQLTVDAGLSAVVVPSLAGLVESVEHFTTTRRPVALSGLAELG